MREDAAAVNGEERAAVAGACEEATVRGEAKGKGTNGCCTCGWPEVITPPAVRVVVPCGVAITTLGADPPVRGFSPIAEA